MTEQSSYRRLREYRDTFDKPAPLAWPELSHGQLLMVLRPALHHQRVAHRVRVQLDAQLSGTGLVAMTETDVEDVALGILRIPDIVVIDEDMADAEAEAIDPRRSHLVVEIVSRSNPENDYEGKLRDYPAMGIPHYLIIDPRDGTALHYWGLAVQNGVPAYDNRQRYTFGETVTVGDWKIETADLPLYTQSTTR
ncbi:Uma2 family endonuclease [Streptomyces sp. NPDC001404]|uniref:Uma2 family endonuclease n=1 Tax=Streptomyces sp. NPDC001404 TaxID=3364571 RepID=UPI00367E55FB